LGGRRIQASPVYRLSSRAEVYTEKPCLKKKERKKERKKEKKEKRKRERKEKGKTESKYLAQEIYTDTLRDFFPLRIFALV